jgi:hypothetical protein
MRMGPGRAWLPFKAREWFDAAGVDFRWDASVRMAPFFSPRITDAFQTGRGSLTVSLFGVLPFIRSRGPALDRGEALRGLSELPWRPFAFRTSPVLSWQAAREDQVRASFDDGQTRVTADFDIDADGHVLGVSAIRPRTVGKSLIDTPWSGVFHSYKTFQGVRLPTYAEVSWHLPQGPFTYWRGRVIEFSLLR